MKKAKNLTLIIGSVCIFLYECWNILNWFSTANFSQLNYKYTFISYHLPAITTSLILVLPILLFVRNLANKTGKVLPVISIVVNSVFLVTALSLTVMAKIPSFLIVSKLSLTKTFLGSVISYLVGGGWLFAVGLLLIIVGSVLSLPKKSN